MQGVHANPALFDSSLACTRKTSLYTIRGWMFRFHNGPLSSEAARNFRFVIPDPSLTRTSSPMTHRPVVGITTWNIDARAGAYPDSWGVGRRYVLAVAEAGGVPQLIPLLGEDPETLARIYDGLDGILFPGGADIGPEEYGAERSPLCGSVDAERDRTELILARWALEEGKPVLGICRGLQLINVAAGGTLYQDLATEHASTVDHDLPDTDGTNPHEALAHDVELSPRSRIERIMGAECVRVNSTHHQGIKELASSLIVSAHAPDEIIEGIESKGGAFVLGVQWHPEDLTSSDRRMRGIFAALVDNAAAWRTRLR